MNRDYKTPDGAAPPDWRGLCEELISLVERCPVTSDTDWIADRNDLIVRFHAAKRNGLAQPEPEVVGPTDGEIPLGPFSEHDLRQQWNQQADEFNQWDSLDSCEQLAWAQVRAIAADRACWGRPAPVPAGEVGEPPAELVEQWMREASDQPPGPDARVIAALAARWGAAQVVERQAAPVPVLPEDAQVIEPSERTILVPVPVPVAVRERLPGPEDCDADGRCWWWDGEWGLIEQRFTDCLVTHWLPAHALPLPSDTESGDSNE